MASFLRRLYHCTIRQKSTATDVLDATTRKMNLNSPDVPPIFLPPVNRSMQQHKVLDKSFFRKLIPLAAAAVSDVRQITAIRKELERSGDLLRISQIKSLRDDDIVAESGKCFLLRQGIDADEPKTWSPTMTKMVEDKLATIRPYNLILTYDDWTMQNILEAILPDLPEDEKETPAGFAQVGHVAHVNLREQYLPYKHIIGQILIDKNANITTVINKTFDVGTESEFRTFPYEVLAGEPNLDVEVHESNCDFRFNFGKVYWNSRLGTEHARVVETFAAGEAVCDVCAGVGPFAIPAGKRKVFVRANDLNPDAVASLRDNIDRNRVAQFVSASCMDGRAFIRKATRELLTTRHVAEVPPPRAKLKLSRSLHSRADIAKAQKAALESIPEPRVFTHYVMNLPASAITFLPAFRGLFPPSAAANFFPHTPQKLPFIHLYLFQAKLASEEEEVRDICARISEQIGSKVELGDEELEMQVRYVRLVAPKKKMFCARFRVPRDIAFEE